MRITFFGASVSEQDVHHATGEMTGFVSYFQANLAQNYDYEISRVTAGSSDVMDAGIVYTERVVALKPDICVLDWVTPSLMECDPRIVQQIYYRLMEHDILPVTLLLPRTDRDQKEIPLSQEMIRISKEFDLPLFVMEDYLGDQPLENNILRDIVHTTALGAKAYAEVVAKILEDIRLPTKPLPKRRAPFHVLKIETANPVPLSARKVEITLRDPRPEPTEFTLVLEQRVGPYSPTLDVDVTSIDGETRHLETYPVFDPWCHRERTCVKRVTNWHNEPGVERITLHAGEYNPGIVAKMDVEQIPANSRHLKPRGDFFIIADRLVICTMKWF